MHSGKVLSGYSVRAGAGKGGGSGEGRGGGGGGPSPKEEDYPLEKVFVHQVKEEFVQFCIFRW